MGLKDLVLDSGRREVKQAKADQVAIRRAALKAGNRSWVSRPSPSPVKWHQPGHGNLIASMFVAKYGGIVVMSDLPRRSFSRCCSNGSTFHRSAAAHDGDRGHLRNRQPDENSPVLVTTNFALTYFIVSGEIEGSKVPAWLLIKDTEGLSV
jgi:acetyl-CoA decarbonylase/synthase, CODH/ACS complex subunit gamma